MSRSLPVGRSGAVAVVALVAAAVAASVPVTAAEPDDLSCPDGQFLVEHFAEVHLEGRPVVQECDETVDEDWGAGRPHPRVPEDRFSTRWTTEVQLAAGTYRFTAGTDDGVRLYVDDVLVIDAWAPRPLRTSVAVGALEAGRHRIVMETFEAGGLAAARLRWERSTSGWFTAPEEHPGHWDAAPGPA